MKKVSIMMPAYNAMPLIQASVDSVMRQTYTNWECIIVDDGSVDGTSAFLDTLSDSRFIVHHFRTNQGRPKARQKALDLSTGDYVTMLDAEDLMSSDRLEVQVRFLDEHPDISLVSSSMCSFGTTTNLLRVRGTDIVHIVDYDGHRCPNHASSMLYGEIARKLRYNPMMKLGQDRDFLERYLNGRSFAELPNVNYYYSEFDSVTKEKIRRTYKLNAKKYLKERKIQKSIIAILKFVYSRLVFPFISIEQIVSNRGRTLTESEKVAYESDCKAIVQRYINF